MAPNLFILTRNIFHPKYLLRHGRKDRVQIKGSISREEHWDEPVPGTYKYTPGQGWFLIRRDDATTRSSMESHMRSDYSGSISSKSASAESLPEAVVYNSILHRYILVSNLKRRLRRCFIPVTKPNAEASAGSGRGTKKQEPTTRMQAFWFLRLDDGKTWVAAWDDYDNFLPGPYLKWRYDREARAMRLAADISAIPPDLTEKSGVNPAIHVEMLAATV